MIQLKDVYWRPVEAQIQALWWDHVFGPMFSVLDMAKPFKNANVSALLDAMDRGAIFYDSGVFSGAFDARTSKELSQFATFDGRSRTWLGMPPPQVIAEAARIKFESKRLNERIATMVPKFQDAVDQALKDIAFPMNTVIVDLARQAQVDMVDLSVMPELTEEAAARLAQNYNESQVLNIKDWSPEQTERLRAVIERNVRSGYNVNELRALIMAEWGVSSNKARFLARQETSLFVSDFRDERYQSAGVEEYVWFSAHDSRCREANKYGGPAHGPGGPLHGHTFRFDDPPVSGTRSERENPGRPFGCRCIAKPILPKR
jgi:SPP1 gp7 family putative phage head morphogenesis protein